MAENEVRVESSIGELFSRMTSDVSRLVQKEMQLAKVELKEETTKAVKAGGKFGAAALTGYLALLFASFALAFLLDQVMPRALAFTIVAVVYGIAAFVLAQQGKSDVKSVEALPETKETLKEDAQWAKTRNS